MSEAETLERIPAHLRCHVVAQAYDRYHAIDQAVWRFVLLQTFARLRQTAHPAYVRGLAQTGISVERIPRIEEMDACLRRFGWGAVCVDGFIPPRAFQAFQAIGILPIAADIRSADHLVYTPAPDIIHEAAGHAPILPDPRYAAYLRAIGQVGARAFASPDDARVYRAIHALSEVKERPDATPAQIAAAERALASATRGVREVSEATRLARLYWWTVEYGLVGTPEDYALYGAGLLSSLGESHGCHRPEVTKLPLTAACVEVDYDITRPQPQLFVARDFEALHEVLEDVSAGLAWQRGGPFALEQAWRSQELATLCLDGASQWIGVVAERWAAGEDACAARLAGPCAWAERDCMREGPFADDVWLAVGPLADGRWPSELASQVSGPGQAPLQLTWKSGLRIAGRLRAVRPDAQGRTAMLVLDEAQVWMRGRPFQGTGPCRVALGTRITSAHAGAADERFHAPTPFADTRVPAERTYDLQQARLLALYDRALAAWEGQLGSQVVPVFERLHRELRDAFPDEWLLRWNLLESLVKLGESQGLAAQLTDELEHLEIRFGHREPIATGLRYLERAVSG